MKFWKQTSIPHTTNAISREAYKTTTALLASSEYVGHDTLNKFVVRFFNISYYLFHFNNISTEERSNSTPGFGDRCSSTN